MKRKRAFTLAEVLITLTIIGVIAALTIPNLMRKWEDNSQISGLKTAYSLLNNALTMAVRENGSLDEWTWPSSASYQGANSTYFANELAKYLKTSKVCPASGAKACLDSPFGHDVGYNGNIRSGRYKRLDGPIYEWTDRDSRSALIVLENNMILHIGIGYIQSPGVSQFYDSWLRVDVNGAKGPNRLGYDVFKFGIGQNGLVFSQNRASNCNKNTAPSYNYNSCAYWVIKHGNMDYKYRDVSAEW